MDSLDGRAVDSLCLHEAFEAWAAADPDRIALTDGERSMTYAELNQNANRLARRLRRLGAGPEVLVGVYAHRSAELIVMLLAVLKTGSGYLPLDPANPPDRLRFIVSDAGCRLVVGQEKDGGLFADTGVEYVLHRDLDEKENASAADTRPSSSPENLAYVIYTSGSTGRPKGVVVSHLNVMRLFAVTAEEFGFTAGDVWTLFHSVAFDFSVWEIWGALLFGARLVIVPYATSRTPGEFLALLRKEGVTILNQTPSAFRQLTSAAESAGFPDDTVRLVIFGGERLDPAILRPWFERCSGSRPRLVNMYGITETTVHVTLRDIKAEDLSCPLSPIGKPLPDLRVYVLDEEGKAVEPGVLGEIYVAGAGLSRGYLGRPDLTADRFVRVVLDGREERLYRTGDLATIDEDGELFYHGRADGQVQLRGFRIELGEIEEALSRSAGVRECAVVVQGQDVDAKLVAFVVGDGLSADRLRATLTGALPEYMVPSLFRSVEALPLTQNGKLDRKALSSDIAASRPVGVEYVPPVGPTEEALAEIWSEVLGIVPIGRFDLFSVVGGTSLKAVQIVNRVRERFGRQIPVRRFFEADALATVARELTRPQKAAPRLPAIRTVSDGEKHGAVASPGQRRLWFLAWLQPRSNAAYNVPAAVRLHGELDPEALRGALDDLLERHDVLRTAFRLVRRDLTRQILDVRADLRIRDISGAASAEEVAMRIARQEAGGSFDLGQAPLLRTTLIKIAEDDHLLVLVLHHLVADGWSLDLMSRDLEVLYAARKDRRTANLPRLTLSYADFVHWHEELIRSEALADDIDHWRRTLKGAPTRLELPADHERPSESSYAGRRLWRVIAPGTREAIDRLARGQRATPYAVLLAALGTCVAQMTGRKDMIIGCPAHGRPSPEMENVVGFFVNTVPIRLEMAHDLSPEESVRKAHQATTTALERQYVTLDSIISTLELQRDLSVQPLIQVVLAYQGSQRFEPHLTTCAQAVPLDNGTAKFDLVLDVAEGRDGMTVSAEYSTDLFDAQTIDHLLDEYVRTLDGYAQATGRPAI